jgi:uncharacterized protein (TIGR02611 family)
VSRRRQWAQWRDTLRGRRAPELGYRIVIAVVGLLVLVVSIIVMPVPGIFVGLGILATEFDWARRLLAYMLARYEAVMAWFRSQASWVRALGVAVVAVVVVTALWLSGVVGWSASLFGVERSWLRSPIGLGA